MTYYKTAKALYERSARLKEIAAPNAAGYAAVKAWVLPRLAAIKAEYRLNDINIKALVMDINACSPEGQRINSLDD